MLRCVVLCCAVLSCQGEIPESVGQLTNVTSLDLTDNHLAGIGQLYAHPQIASNEQVLFAFVCNVRADFSTLLCLCLFCSI